jgi:hypothetical protein
MPPGPGADANAQGVQSQANLASTTIAREGDRMPHAVLAPPPLPLAHRLCALARRHPDRLHMIADVGSPRLLLDIMDSCDGVGYEVLPVGDDRIADRTQALLEEGYHVSLMRCGLRSIVVLGQTSVAVDRLRSPRPVARAGASGLPRLRWLTLVLLLLLLAG